MYYYEDYLCDIYNIMLLGKNIIKIVDEDVTYDGRKIYGLKIGKGKVKAIISAGVHGREYTNVSAVIHMIKKTIHDYNKGYCLYKNEKINIKNIYNNNSLIIVPLVNPDGYEIALRGYDVVNNKELQNKYKASNKEYYLWKNNVLDVDINRNFQSILWKSKFKGDKPFSQTESRFLKRIFDKYYGGIYVDIHSRGENIYYYRKALDNKYNEEQLIIAKELSALTGYRISKPEEEINYNDTGGNTVHYYSETYRCSAITIETVKEDEHFPINMLNSSKTYEQIKDLLVYLMVR